MLPTPRFGVTAMALTALVVSGCAKAVRTRHDDRARPSPPDRPDAPDGADRADEGHPPAASPSPPVLIEATPGVDGIRLAWSAGADEPPQTYFVSLAAARYGCERKLATYEVAEAGATTLTLAPDLPGGRYAVCLEAVRGAQRIPAANQGQLIFEQPPTVHLALLRGDGPDARSLVHAVVQRDGALAATVVASSSDRRRLAGRASLQVSAGGRPTLAFLGIDDGITAAAALSLVLAHRADDGRFRSVDVLAAARPMHAGLSGLLALSESEATVLSRIAGDGGGQLVLSRAPADQSVVSVNLATVHGADSFADSGLAVDEAGRLHVAYLHRGGVHYRRHESGRWTDAVAVETPGCAEAVLLGVAARGGRVALAYACSSGDQAAGRCDLAFASAPADGVSPPRGELALALDAANACLPFSPSRPSVAVDALGRARVAVRARTDGTWDVAVAEQDAPDQALGAPRRLGDPDALLAAPIIALDATDRAWVVYHARRGLRLTVGTDGSPRPVSIDLGAAAGAPPPSPLLELADVAIPGGPGRSNLPFGNWVR